MEFFKNSDSKKPFKPWIEAQLDLLTSATTVEELVSGLSKASCLLGFDHFSFGVRSWLPISSPKVEFVANYPKNYQEKYDAEGYLQTDPTVLRGMKSTSPFVWDEDFFSTARPLWEESVAAGLCHGWAQSSHIRPGIGGMLTLSRSSEPISQHELDHLTPNLIWFNQLAQIGLHDILLKKIVDISNIQLTNRETEIMRWTADGKTAGEISMILSIAERTVNFHITNVMKKFNVSSKIAASVQAVLLGII